jgi:DNA-binding transcriptional LysR family regulator
MDNFPIPAEYCLIVNTFSKVPTLRQVATLLNMDPAGLVRKVQRISEDFGFLIKVGNRWMLTESGHRVARWTEEYINSQKRLIEEKPQFRVAAFAWLTEEVLVPRFNELQSYSGKDVAWSFKMTAADLEQEIIHNRSDFVIHGHAPNDPAVAHKKIASFPWVVVVPISWKKNLPSGSSEKLLSYLNSKPFVRHSGINPAQILGFSPKKTADIIIDGVIGVRAAVIAEEGWSALPAMSVISASKQKLISKLEIPTNIRDDLSLWWLRSRKDSAQQVRILTKWLSSF